MKDELPPIETLSNPKLKALYRLHLPVIGTVEIPLRGPNMGMAHQSLDCPKVIPVVEEGRGKRMPHHVRMNPLLDQCLFYHALDETVNSFRGQPPFLVRAVLPQCLEEGMIRAGPIPVGLQVILDDKKGLCLQRDAYELLSLTDDIDDGSWTDEKMGP